MAHGFAATRWHGLGRFAELFAAAGFVVSGEHRYAFQQRGLPGAVFADDDGDGAIETQLELIPQERKAKRIGRPIGNARWLEPDPLEVRCRHLDDAISF